MRLIYMDSPQVMRTLPINLCTVGLALAMTIGLPMATVQAQYQNAIKKGSISGLWNSSEGKINFLQSGPNIVGTYPQDNGILRGKLSGNVLTGYWIEDAADQRCNTPRDGRYYWGKIRFVFDGSSFQGLWSYCNDEPSYSWTGRKGS